MTLPSKEKPMSHCSQPKVLPARLPIVACALLTLLVLAHCGGQTEQGESKGVSPGYCAKACSVTSDCCAAEDPNCPGEYPRNFSCENGLCRAPRCETDAHCAYLLGDTGSMICRERDGLPSCLRACAVDDDCGAEGGLAAGTCSALADDGTRVCEMTTGGLSLGCKTDEDCPVGRHCQSGTCGCEQDAECGPRLDVCTQDRAFAYPSFAAAAPR
jgi:hypothetical protein